MKNLEKIYLDELKKVDPDNSKLSTILANLLMYHTVELGFKNQDTPEQQEEMRQIAKDYTKRIIEYLNVTGIDRSSISPLQMAEVAAEITEADDTRIDIAAIKYISSEFEESEEEYKQRLLNKINPLGTPDRKQLNQALKHFPLQHPLTEQFKNYVTGNNRANQFDVVEVGNNVPRRTATQGSFSARADVKRPKQDTSGIGALIFSGVGVVLGIVCGLATGLPAAVVAVPVLAACGGYSGAKIGDKFEEFISGKGSYSDAEMSAKIKGWLKEKGDLIKGAKAQYDLSTKPNDQGQKVSLAYKLFKATTLTVGSVLTSLTQDLFSLLTSEDDKGNQSIDPRKICKALGVAAGLAIGIAATVALPPLAFAIPALMIVGGNVGEALTETIFNGLNFWNSETIGSKIFRGAVGLAAGIGLSIAFPPIAPFAVTLLPVICSVGIKKSLSATFSKIFEGISWIKDVVGLGGNENQTPLPPAPMVNPALTPPPPQLSEALQREASKARQHMDAVGKDAARSQTLTQRKSTGRGGI